MIPTGFYPLTDTFGDKPRFVHCVQGVVNLNRLTITIGGPQLLTETASIVGDQGVGGFENVVGGTVILL